MLKNCAICGKEFNALGNARCCGAKCSRLRANKVRRKPCGLDLEKHRRECRDWSKSHSEVASMRASQWNKAHPEKRLEIARKWRTSEHGRASKSALAHNRRVHLSVSPVTAEMVIELKSEYAGLCPYCNSVIVKGHIDHIVPVCKGGTSERNNLVWVCAACNGQKYGKGLLRFMLYQRAMAEHFQWA